MNNVIHLVKDQKFVLNLSKTDPEVQGVILYEKIADNHLDLYHTESTEVVVLELYWLEQPLTTPSRRISRSPLPVHT